MINAYAGQVAAEHGVDLWHKVLHWLGDNFGYGLVVLVLFVSVLMFKDKLIKFLPPKIQDLFK